MPIHLNALRLSVKADGESTERTIKFGPGLNVVQARNSAGKSTVVKAIAYAMGLEGAFGPQQVPPVPHVLTDSIDFGGRRRQIQESAVELEITNGPQVATLRREVRTTRDSRIVTVWDAPRLTAAGGATPGVDFFARAPGAAVRERGISYWLASFAGWTLPMVPRKDGDQSPLYLECLLPTFFVEQKHGWAGILSSMPYHLGIRDMRVRALEFVLALESSEVARKREVLKLAIEEVQSQWSHRAASLKAVAAPLGVLRNLPAAAAEDFDPAKVAVFVSAGNAWISLSDSLRHDTQRLRELPQVAPPRVRDVDPRLAEELKKAQEALAGLEVVGRRALEEEAQERAQLSATRERIADITDQLRKFQDLKRLEEWGSVENLRIHDRHCPTCRQAVSDTLLRQSVQLKVMTVPENVGFLKSQKDTFEALLAAGERALEAKTARVEAIRAEQATLRAKIRSLKEELTQHPQVPSTDIIRERVILEERIRQREAMRGQIEERLSDFGRMSERFTALSAALKGLPHEEVTEGDRQKLNALQASLWQQLVEYNLTSLPVESIKISTSSYQPSHEGYDLGHDLSASDTVRTIWAFLTGMLEVARQYPTNHPGLLIFDEPRQQHAEQMSYQALLRRVASSVEFGQQVIFATSEEPEKLKEMLQGKRASVVQFPGRILGGPEPIKWTSGP